MASGRNSVRIVRTGRRREAAAIGVVAVGLLVGYLTLHPAESAKPVRRDPAAPPTAAVAAPPTAATTEEGRPVDPKLPTHVPKTTGGKIRALRALGIEHTKGPDGKPRLGAAPVIEALNAAGIHEGIAAFPPPGTNPPKAGIIVPEDFALPEGYVRHHQVTDDGEDLPPILMFHPDYVFTDEAGKQIQLPSDGVVPPELAPPGMPVQMLEIPPASR